MVREARVSFSDPLITGLPAQRASFEDLDDFCFDDDWFHGPHSRSRIRKKRRPVDPASKRRHVGSPDWPADV